MPRPQQQTITLTIDGREVQAPENAMLVDAARHGDVEIPVFCYEPKLGNPIGACRMCLVEIEAARARNEQRLAAVPPSGAGVLASPPGAG